jgi:hypothetical protein
VAGGVVEGEVLVVVPGGGCVAVEVAGVLVGGAVLVVVTGATVIEREAVAAAPAASVTRTLILKVPEEVGAPEMMPEALSVRPAGIEPETRDHEYGGVPPIADNVWA